MIQAVIFDHDGTLVDSEGRHYELWQEVLSPYDIDFTAEEYIKEHSGIPTIKNAEILISKYSLPLTAQALYDLKDVMVEQSVTGKAFELLPDVLETMESFQAHKLDMAIATGAGFREVNSSVNAHGFDRYIQCFATSEEVAKGKPAPDVYLLAAKKLGVAPANCIAIEDSNNGLQSAIAAGIPCVVVKNTWSAAKSYQGARAVFDSMKEAREYILSSL